MTPGNPLVERATSVDKSTDKWELYLAVYADLFERFRGKPISILEIGVQNGGFTEALAAYFPDAIHVVGCDIDERCGALTFADPRISVVIGNAANKDTGARVRQVTDAFDIIIDDGSHKSGDLIAVFCEYFTALRDGGIYISEDLHCSYWYEYEGGLAHEYSSMNFFKKLADIVNYEYWGVPDPRARLLSVPLAHHGCELAEAELERILSVSFYNSLCVVRRDAARNTLLGRRLILGGRSTVADNSAFDRSAPMNNDQRGNPFSDLDALTNRNVFGLFFEIGNDQKRLSADLAGTNTRLAALQHELSSTVQGAVQEEETSLLAKIDVLHEELSNMTKRLTALIKEQNVSILRRLVRSLRRRISSPKGLT